MACYVCTVDPFQRYGDGNGNATEENSNMLSLIQIC